jgi:hypothetical protein
MQSYQPVITSLAPFEFDIGAVDFRYMAMLLSHWMRNQGASRGSLLTCFPAACLLQLAGTASHGTKN